ncbi:MAG: hypothetical protein ACLPX1_10435, partial [Steroidobacteraceae bacterium]
CWHLVFLNDADQKGTSSFHDITYEGMPIAKVFVRPAKKSGEVISVTACHEAGRSFRRAVDRRAARHGVGL